MATIFKANAVMHSRCNRVTVRDTAAAMLRLRCKHDTVAMQTCG